jgi:hypothetical protein
MVREWACQWAPTRKGVLSVRTHTGTGSRRLSSLAKGIVSGSTPETEHRRRGRQHEAEQPRPVDT